MSKEFGGKKVNVQNFCCQNIELVPVIWFKISRKLHQQFKREILLLVPLIHREIGRVLDGGKNIYAYAYIDTKKVNEQFKINRKSDMIYDWMINVIGKKKNYILAVLRMRAWWMCDDTFVISHQLHGIFRTPSRRARSPAIVTKFIANEPIVIGTLYVAWRVNESYWLGIDFSVWNTNERIFIQTLTERKKIVDGALKMCKYDWMAIVHRIACDVNDTVNGWGSGQTRSLNEINGFSCDFSSFSIFINIAKLKV